tara:strand:- start:112 stop:939 length:828 start_codon:yes stop_codon:yes gene_type:complete
MAIYTNAQIKQQWLPLNINRLQANNLGNITVERPNNAIRLWDLLDCFIANNFASIGSNYAVTSLIADADRTHTWAGFNLAETFTTGNKTETYTNGTAIATLQRGSADISFNVVDGTTYSNLYMNTALAQMNWTDGTDSAQLVTSPAGISMNLSGTTALVINADAGIIGQILTSQGSSTAPLWTTPTPTSKTTTRTDISHTILITEDLIVVHTNNDLTITLPSAPSLGDTHTVKQIVTGTIIDGNGNTIDGGASYTLPIIYQSATLTYDGTEWVII